MAFTSYLDIGRWVASQPVGVLHLGGGFTIRQPTDEELAEQRFVRQHYEQEHAKRQAEYEAAEARAASLLLTYLSPEQVKQYRENGHFDLIGSLGGQYRIRPARAYNVQLRRDGAEAATFCGGPAGVPLSDMMLAQYLALVADEAGFIAVANCSVPAQHCGCFTCRNYFGTP